MENLNNLTAQQTNALFREPALALMEKYGFEETHAAGWSEEGFNFIKPIGGDEESRRGFDGWESIKDYFEEVEKLVENYTQEQLKNRLNGDFSLIEYGAVNDYQLQLAINAKDLERAEQEAASTRPEMNKIMQEAIEKANAHNSAIANAQNISLDRGMDK